MEREETESLEVSTIMFIRAEKRPEAVLRVMVWFCRIGLGGEVVVLVGSLEGRMVIVEESFKGVKSWR